MEFGLQFFPSVGPAEKSAQQYWDEALRLCEHADALGYSTIRTVEHHCHAYGGYSPNPHIFLTAASQRAKRARLISGAVLPAFNHPIKVAGEIGLLDAISSGRLECGFARAFVPHEFAQFGVSFDESRARFEEGMEAVRRLLEEEDVTFEGRFHKFAHTTSLPRPTQRPRPPFWVAALGTPESFEKAGRNGYHVMAIPLAGGMMKELLSIYRAAWRAAGHPGDGKVLLAFAMFCHHDRDEAHRIAREPMMRYLRSLLDAASDWTHGASSRDYPGYDRMIAGIAAETFESQIEKGAAWVGTPDNISRSIEAYQALVGGFEAASLQVNFHALAFDHALSSMRLFSEAVMPRFGARGAR